MLFVLKRNLVLSRHAFNFVLAILMSLKMFVLKRNLVLSRHAFNLVLAILMSLKITEWRYSNWIKITVINYIFAAQEPREILLMKLHQIVYFMNIP